MPDVQDIKAAIGEHQPLTGLSQALPKLRELATPEDLAFVLVQGRNDLGEGHGHGANLSHFDTRCNIGHLQHLGPLKARRPRYGESCQRGIACPRHIEDLSGLGWGVNEGSWRAGLPRAALNGRRQTQ